MSMKIDWSLHIDELKKRREADRHHLIEKHNLDPDVDCPLCGDTGFDLEHPKAPCRCVYGQKVVYELEWRQKWSSEIPARFQNFTLDSHPDRQLVAEAEKWIDMDPLQTGANLVMTGGPGRGKTGLAIGLLHRFHHRDRRVVYWSVPELMDELRSEQRSDTPGLSLGEARSADLLLLDDMGKDRPTPYAQERLYVLVDGRYRERKPTIITTNFTGSALTAHLGDALVSRLKESCHVIVADGPIDYRQPRPSPAGRPRGEPAQREASVPGR